MVIHFSLDGTLWLSIRNEASCFIMFIFLFFREDFNPEIQGRVGSRHRPQGHAPLGSPLLTIDTPAVGLSLGVEGGEIFKMTISI